MLNISPTFRLQDKNLAEWLSRHGVNGGEGRINSLRGGGGSSKVTVREVDVMPGCRGSAKGNKAFRSTSNHNTTLEGFVRNPRERTASYNTDYPQCFGCCDLICCGSFNIAKPTQIHSLTDTHGLVSER